MTKAHWLALTKVSGIGGVTTRKLIDRFGSIEAIFDAPAEELLEIPRVTADIVSRLHAVSIDDLDEELLSLSDGGFTVLTWGDEDYPGRLRPLHDSPPLLFVFGTLLPADADAVAIVGTRRPMPRAIERAEMLARELAERGVSVVSGLAAGIDTAAHRGALEADAGRTLAVLGSGIRFIHPRENVPLAQEIIERGALLSELHPDTPPKGQGLMARDRIISGLSRAVIVVEAAEKSGSLDTAKKATRQGRLLFAVPGSPGTDALIRAGAESLDPDSVDMDALAHRIRAYEPDEGGPAESDAGAVMQLGLGL